MKTFTAFLIGVLTQLQIYEIHADYSIRQALFVTSSSAASSNVLVDRQSEAVYVAYTLHQAAPLYIYSKTSDQDASTKSVDIYCSNIQTPTMHIDNLRSELIFAYYCPWDYRSTVTDLDGNFKSTSLFTANGASLRGVVSNQEIQFIARDSKNLYRLNRTHLVWTSPNSLTSGNLFSAAALSLDKTKLYILETNVPGDSIWKIFDYNTGNLVGPSTFQCPKSFLKFHKSGTIFICPLSDKRISIKNIFNNDQNETAVEIPNDLVAVEFSDNYFVVLTKTPTTVFILTFMGYDLSFIQNIGLHSSLFALQYLSSIHDSFYVLVSALSAVQINSTMIRKGLNALKFDLKQQSEIIQTTSRSTSTMTQGSTTTVIRQPMNPTETQNIPTIIASASAFVLALVFISLFVRWRMRKSNDATEKDTASMTDCTEITMNTLNNTKLPLAIPAYLEIKLTQYRFEKLIASGGGGSIFMVKLINFPELPDSMANHDFVAKVPLGKHIWQTPQQPLTHSFSTFF